MGFWEAKGREDSLLVIEEESRKTIRKYQKKVITIGPEEVMESLFTSQKKIFRKDYPKCKEASCKQKSRELLLKEDEKNIKFFHKTDNAHRK